MNQPRGTGLPEPLSPRRVEDQDPFESVFRGHRALDHSWRRHRCAAFRQGRDIRFALYQADQKPLAILHVYVDVLTFPEHQPLRRTTNGGGRNVSFHPADPGGGFIGRRCLRH